MVDTIQMFPNRLVKVFGKSARYTLASFTILTIRNVLDNVGEGACKIMPNNEIGFRSGNVAELNGSLYLDERIVYPIFILVNYNYELSKKAFSVSQYLISLSRYLGL